MPLSSGFATFSVNLLQSLRKFATVTPGIEIGY